MDSGAARVSEREQMRRRAAGALTLSVVGHLVVIGWLTDGEPVPRRSFEAAAAAEFELMAVPDVPEPSSAAIATPSTDAVQPASQLRRKVAVAARAEALGDAPGDEASLVSDATVTPMSEPRAQETFTHEGAAPAIDARTAALTVIEMPTDTTRIAQDNANLTAHLTAAAAARPYLARRDPPALRRTDAGGYVHEAPGFRAYIRSDGSVAFQDHIANDDDGLDFGSGDPQAAGFHFTPFRFDITDMMLKAMGEELYTPEKRWFLEQTQELREALEADDRLHLFARAREDLRHALRVLVDDTRLTLEQKRQAVFELWADCAEDEVGWRGRHVIEEFVRENFRPGTPRAFTSAELRHMNQRNASSARFDPYSEKPPLP